MRDGHRILLLGLVVIALLCWGWAASAFWQARSLSRQIAELDEQRLALSRRIAETQRQKERYEAMVRELGEPLKRFNPGALTARLMEQVEGALTQSRLKVETLQPLSWQVNAEGRWVRLPVQVTAVTTQPNLNDALQGITELLQRLRRLHPPLVTERWSMQVISQPKPAFRVQAVLVWLVPVDEAVVKTLSPSRSLRGSVAPTLRR